MNSTELSSTCLVIIRPNCGKWNLVFWNVVKYAKKNAMDSHIVSYMHTKPTLQVPSPACRGSLHAPLHPPQGSLGLLP